MTVIACKVSKGFIEIASDNQTTWGDSKFPKKDSSDKQIKASGKIWSVNGATIGCAGSVAVSGLLQMYTKTHLPKEMERDSIVDWFIEFRDWAKAKAKIEYNDISIHAIIIKDGRAFTFYDFMDVFEIKDFTAVGSGMFLAIGAMEIGASVQKAVGVAIKYDLYCGGKVDYKKIK